MSVSIWIYNSVKALSNTDVAFTVRKTVKDAETACRYTEQIAALHKGDYQMITAVHKENQGNSLYHAHFVMNTVNINNGKLYHSGRAELKQFAMHIHEVTGNYCKTEIKKLGMIYHILKHPY